MLVRRLIPIVGRTCIQRVRFETYATSQQNLKRNKVLKKLTRTKRGSSDITSRDNILQLEIIDALSLLPERLSIEEVEIPNETVEKYLFTHGRPETVVENVSIIYQTSEGDGLGFVANKVVKIPKTCVGDIVTAKLKRHHQYYAEATLVAVTKKSVLRRKSDLVVCGKFSECSGCQFQMIPYDEQLQFKSDIIKRAFEFFHPTFNKEAITGVVESPMQYSYRTKLTPHYQFNKYETAETGIIPIGFNSGGKGGGIVDVDNCPIATQPINQMLPQLRDSVHERIATRMSNHEPVKGETLLLRESTRVDHKTGEFDRVCITNPKMVITEKIGDYTFQFPASEFFQVNNGILPDVLNYIQHHMGQIDAQNLVDAYCGSGFFGISLANEVPGKVFGIELSKSSIKYASHNASLNGLKEDKIQYLEGDAKAIFNHEEFLSSGIIGEESIVIMDPSRKGSSESFLKQLLEFKPKLIVYISCNVFTQARDLATFDKLQRENNDDGNVKYMVKEVTGFDFFPQTKHVESVAIIERVE